MAAKDDLATLRTKLERLRKESDKAQGAYDQVMAQIKERHGCATLEEAEKKLKGMESKAVAAEEEFQTALKKFMKDHGDDLNS